MNSLLTIGANSVKSMSASKSFLIGRDTLTGELVSVEKARHGNPERYVVERMPKAGYGDSN